VKLNCTQSPSSGEVEKYVPPAGILLRFDCHTAEARENETIISHGSKSSRNCSWGYSYARRKCKASLLCLDIEFASVTYSLLVLKPFLPAHPGF